ncbi:prolyl oligopeptidase family serine peptidase [Parapedobacter lycopersici]|uniref:prolyl oligopeptidase family serine peptidase n=1 Tax=Parapedobacter lycopersici TaxID=1864939 RepID=UPI00214D3896|nr:prolyl oligopeptidase family serine peptidase [Parapedobacter lycopersici]
MKINLFIILLCLGINLTYGQTSLKGIDLKNGNYTVGFTHYLTTDSTRTYTRIFDWSNTSIPRPVPVSVWYPSEANRESVKTMTVLNYMEILKEEEEWEYLPDDQILNWFYYANTPANQDHLKEHTTAHKGIGPATGKFPVVVYAPSYQASSIENFALCEYLASRGYIVIASPSRGTENRFLEGGTEKDMETQARDIEFLLKEVGKLPNADIDRIATMGFSFGGLSNVLSQMRNEVIKAIVSLDGSVKYQYNTLKRSSFFDIEKVDVPFIHFAQKDIPKQVLKEDNIDSTLSHHFEFYDSLVYSKAYQLKFHNLTHSYFSTLGVLFQERDKRQDKSDLEIMESYKWVSVYTLKFLDGFLKNDNDALSFLENSPVENGINEGLIIQQTKNPQDKPFTFQDFNTLASKQDYENLKELYDSISKKNPSVQLSEGDFNNLGLQLVFNPSTSRQGINIFLLAINIFPHSANLFDSLAEAYLFLGNKSKAIESFEKSLSLNPQNQHAVDRLKQIRE